MEHAGRFRVVAALGAAQTLAWASSYYRPAMLAVPMARDLARAMGIGIRALLREKGTPFQDLRLGEPKWTDDDLLDFMLAHPILINRPIVVTPLATKLCRPSESVREILPSSASRAL